MYFRESPISISKSVLYVNHIINALSYIKISNHKV